MNELNHSTSGSSAADGVFVTTRWTEVLSARGDSPLARQALSDLCAAYYGPIVVFLRREGRGEDAARELAHEFFAGVLDRHSLGGADPDRGRFRSYLLGALKHFLANQRLRESREKRGGRFIHEPIGPGSDTASDASIPDSSAPSLDALFDREWALSILERVFATMKEEATRDGALQEFEILKPWLTGETADRTQGDAARELDRSVGAVRVAIHRLRHRFRESVRAEVAQTVRNPGDVAVEMRHLIAALA